MFVIILIVNIILNLLLYIFFRGIIDNISKLDKGMGDFFNYLLNPSKGKQIVRHYYINKYSPMPSMKMFMTEKEMENISNYLTKNY